MFIFRSTTTTEAVLGSGIELLRRNSFGRRLWYLQVITLRTIWLWTDRVYISLVPRSVSRIYVINCVSAHISFPFFQLTCWTHGMLAVYLYIVLNWPFLNIQQRQISNKWSLWQPKWTPAQIGCNRRAPAFVCGKVYYWQLLMRCFRLANVLERFSIYLLMLLLEAYKVIWRGFL